MFLSREFYVALYLSDPSIFRSYHYPRLAGLERQEKCEDPEYQRSPENSHIYGDVSRGDITPVNTYYPPATVCYVDQSAGKLRLVKNKKHINLLLYVRHLS